MKTKQSEIFRFSRWTIVLLALGLPPVQAETDGPVTDKCTHGGTQSFPLAADGGDLVGANRYVKALASDSLHDIACRNNIGIEEIFMANDLAKIDHWSPGEGTRVLIPQRFILPNAPRAGIVVNIPEMRLYYYPVKYAPVVKKIKATPKPKPGVKGKAAVPPPKPPASVTEVGEPIDKAAEVLTFPVSMGRMDWRTPLGKTRIASKVKDPTWTPPESIRREHAAKGDILPAVVPAGPDNPLGAFAMRLGVAGYLIHGTEQNYKSFGIGMRVTHGCMRMYNEDVARLFPRVAVGTPVYLVNQPVKLGWQGGRLYMEVHPPMDEDAGIPPEKDEDEMSQAELAREEAKTPEQRAAEKKRKDEKRFGYLQKAALNLVDKENMRRPLLLDREAMRKALETPTGIPIEIGKEAPPLEATTGEPVANVDGSAPSNPTESARMPADAGQNDSLSPSSELYGAEQPVNPPVGEINRAVPAEEYTSDPSGAEQAVPAREYSPVVPGEAVSTPNEMEPAAEYRQASEQYPREPGVGERSESRQSVPDPYAPDESAPVLEEPPQGDLAAPQSAGGR